MRPLERSQPPCLLRRPAGTWPLPGFARLSQTRDELSALCVREPPVQMPRDHRYWPTCVCALSWPSPNWPATPSNTVSSRHGYVWPVPLRPG